MRTAATRRVPRTTLAAPIDVAASAVQVADKTNHGLETARTFPINPAYPFRIRVGGSNGEVMTVTAGHGTRTWTVTRPNPVAHDAGTLVEGM